MVLTHVRVGAAGPCLPLTDRFLFLVPTPFSCCTVSLLAPWVTWLDALFISPLSPFAPTTTYVQVFCLFLLYQFFRVSCLRLVCHISLLLSLLFCWVRSDVHILLQQNPLVFFRLHPLSSSSQASFSQKIFFCIILNLTEKIHFKYIFTWKFFILKWIFFIPKSWVCVKSCWFGQFSYFLC